MKLDPNESSPLDDATGMGAAVTHADVRQRIRGFAVLRAAQRALSSSSAGPLDATELGAMRGIRERLARAASRFDAESSSVPAPPLTSAETAELRRELQSLDADLAGYRRMLLARVERLPLSQLRATLSRETHAQRVEASSLLEVCLAAEPLPRRYLRVLDFLLTLLCAARRDGRWILEFDPADLNDVVRRRCEQFEDLDSSVEAQILHRFQQAADQLATLEDGSAVIRDMADYKVAVAGFYFAPSVLRCIIGYNVGARNHIADRTQRGRALDAEIESELGCFAPLQDADPRAASRAGPGLPAHEAPGVLAVQEAIRQRLLGVERPKGPAERIAAELDLRSLERDERSALLDPSLEGVHRVIRLAVVLGHLAASLPGHEADVEMLGLKVAQLDDWICALAGEVQREIDTLIRGNEYEGAVRLGDTKGRFLAAVQVLARRRLGRAGRSRAPSDRLQRDAVALLREYLERERFQRTPPLFMDLFGGGWRRSVALATAGLLLAFVALSQLLPDRHPRRVDSLETWQARDISTLLASAYRDHAERHSLFVGTLRDDRWKSLSAAERRDHAEVIRDRVRERGVDEVLLFDEERVLQAHYFEGAWRTGRAWEGH